METKYNPKEAEENHYKRWEEIGCFKPELNENADAETYSIVIPPPNVTGSLHMGHALQHTIMDSLIRRKRMQGFKTLWLVGTDHAGISVQRKVTQQIGEELKKTPQEVGREEFLRRAWKWKEKYGGTILKQMRREGASVDWTRERFTMSDELSKAVRNVFIKLYEEGSIYRGARIVNWCPNDKTVLSDLEVQDLEKKDGKLYYLQYPIAESGERRAVSGQPEKKDSIEFLTVATTRPETMLGDTAVAVNPNDERFKNLIGKMVDLPLANRQIPIIADEYVDMEFGTGAVKITPAHDPNDYEMGKRHNLPELNIMNLDGSMNSDAGEEFDGLDRYIARKLVIEKFEELNLLEKISDHEMVLPICERCKTVVETLISEQWWVNMDGMRDLALELKSEKGYPRFTPHNPHTKVYTDWLEGLKDWTISRQLWWGHQIPAWYDESGNVYVAKNKEEAIEQAGTSQLTQDEDVLDTWFSSWLWSFSTMGWNGETVRSPESEVQSQDEDSSTLDSGLRTQDLKDFHPTNVLVTARDIIFLWVSRMVMAGLKFTGERPFDDVYITGTIMGADGKPMSKTRGNGVDPIDMFEQYGVDATRIYLASISTGMDIKWSDLKIESYRNFANKIWNATRFCLMNAEGAKVDVSTISEQEAIATASIADKWIISRLNKTAKEVNEALDKYAFHVAVDKLYHFFWDDFCDWYIELVKDEISSQQEESEDRSPKSEVRILARTRIITILEQSLRLLHPFMPYLTEELWQKLPETNAGLHNAAYKSADATIMLADFPMGNAELIDEKAEAEMQTIIELITKIRNIRAEMQIKPSDNIDVHIAANVETQKIFDENEAQILKLARANKIILGDKLNVPDASAKGVLTNGAEIGIPLEGLIDFDKERERLQNQIDKLEKEGEQLSKQLSNRNFVEKAPAEKVEAVRERVAEIETQTKALSENLESLK